MKKNINLLLCDTFPGLLPSYIPSYVSMFTTLFDAVSPEVSYTVYPVMEDKLPTAIHPDEIYLITGCNLSVYDDVAWIRQLLAWIVAAHERKTKLVGVCFGHQAIAEALGGKVERASVGWGVGIRASRVVDATASAYFPEGRMHLLYNHHDQVIRLPECATLMSTSDFCPVESFRIGSHVLSFQGHPEYIPAYEEHLIRNFADDEPDAVKKSALESLNALQHQGSTVARWILEAM